MLEIIVILIMSNVHASSDKIMLQKKIYINFKTKLYKYIIWDI